MQVITSPGTGLDIVTAICKALDMNLRVIRNTEDLKKAKPDRLLLLGGKDINPFYYGEGQKYTNQIDQNRDLLEWYMIRRAMTQRIPIMGICRGMQMVAVAHGGSLYQDIYRQRVTTTHPKTHEIGITGRIGNFIPTNRVNSYHHQAVRRVPNGFKVLARSLDDDLVEAIYRPGVIGVQWHPELMFRSDPRWISLFRWLKDGLE